MTFADLQNTGRICWMALRSDGIQMLTINISVHLLEHRKGNKNMSFVFQGNNFVHLRLKTCILHFSSPEKSLNL